LIFVLCPPSFPLATTFHRGQGVRRHATSEAGRSGGRVICVKCSLRTRTRTAPWSCALPQYSPSGSEEGGESSALAAIAGGLQNRGTFPRWPYTRLTLGFRLRRPREQQESEPEPTFPFAPLSSSLQSSSSSSSSSLRECVPFGVRAEISRIRPDQNGRKSPLRWLVRADSLLKEEGGLSDYMNVSANLERKEARNGIFSSLCFREEKSRRKSDLLLSTAITLFGARKEGEGSQH